MNAHNVVNEFEKRIAEYCGAPYAVAVDSCTNAIMMAVKYVIDTCHCDDVVALPKYTYVGVAQAVKNAGGEIIFKDKDWEGAYQLGIRYYNDELMYYVIDSARHLFHNMYQPQSLTCLSFHWYKTLPIGKGGAILTDDYQAYLRLKKMRYDGRTEGLPIHGDHIIQGWHCIMSPEDGARGLKLLDNVKPWNDPIPWDDYTDLSKMEVFK